MIRMRNRPMGLSSAAAIRTVLGLLLAVFAAAAHAQLDITVRKGLARPVPIAVVPFGWQGSGPPPYDLAAVITADLGNSGRFAPMAVRDMISRPTEPAQVNFQDWRVSDVDALVIGRLQQTGPDDFTAQFQLFDVIRGRQLLGFRLTSNRDNLRATAHRIADMIFEELTGIPGVFSTQIAYVSEERSGETRTYRLIVADADGENARVIAESNQPLMSPSWSPDGRRIAYVSFEGNQSAIYVQTLRTGTRERVSMRAGHNGAPVFSPDGRRLALTLSLAEGNFDIYTLDLATQVLRRLTDSPAIDTEPTWSPDGETIYFMSDRAGGPQIYRVSANGGRAERVTFEGDYNARPRISPDGNELAVVHRDRGNFRIATFDLRTGRLKQVLTNGLLDESPSYAPNGAVLIYATRERGRGVLATATTDGTIQQQIASGSGDVREPVWGPFPRP
ncbi:MAG: Tol-Pal system beta propeller repeat protein TolB [Gammaproteobacteria bacterium]